MSQSAQQLIVPIQSRVAMSLSLPAWAELTLRWLEEAGDNGAGSVASAGDCNGEYQTGKSLESYPCLVYKASQYQ